MVMTLAGDTARCVAYPMGNHVTAEAMYRHDPSAMLYVPMRTVITRRDGERSWFTFDQPSSQLGSLGNPAIAATGREIDRQLAATLDQLDSPAPSCLTTGMSATESRAAGSAAALTARELDRPMRHSARRNHTASEGVVVGAGGIRATAMHRWR